MKSQLKKIIPCIMAGVAGISYGKPIDNSNSEMNGISTATEEENVASNKDELENNDENKNFEIEKISVKEFENKRAESKKNKNQGWNKSNCRRNFCK